MMMNLANGVFLDVDTLGDDVDRHALAEVLPSWQWRHAASRIPVFDAVRNADVIVTNKVLLSAAVLEHCTTRLRLICIAATGTNNVDLEAASRRGVVVCNVRGYATASVVQYVFSVMLNLVTRLDDYREHVRRGEWSRSQHFSLLREPITELSGKTLGIIGYGTLGKAVAAAARIFDMKVLVAARDGEPAAPGRVELHALLRAADVVSLHCPLTPQTRALINGTTLREMKRGAILINTARGALVEPFALLESLQSGHLRGAAIDVLDVEPPPLTHPLIQARLPNLIVTPHIAWASGEARQRLVGEIAQNIAAFARGEPRNVVL